MNTIEEIANVLKNAKSAVIYTHMRPDGDTLGCGMALHRAFFSLGIPSEVVCESPVPEKLRFLGGMREIKQRPTLSPEVVICVDTSDLSRLGAIEEDFRMRAKRAVSVNFDHHVSNTRYAKYNFVRERASNAENVLELIEAMGVAVAGDVASYLLLGMVTDSGVFSHGDVDGDTLRAAAKAVDGGGDLSSIVYESTKRQTKARSMLFAETVGKLRYLLDDRLAVAVITNEQLSRLGLGPDATEGIVDFGLTVDCVEVSASLFEMKRGQYKASLRSKGKTDVNAVARTFGGGGHVLASGCMLFGELEEVVDKLRYAVFQHLEDA